MNLTLSVDDEVIREARQHAEALGTSVNQLVREYLEHLAGKTNPAASAAEFDSPAWRKGIPEGGNLIAKKSGGYSDGYSRLGYSRLTGIVRSLTVAFR